MLSFNISNRDLRNFHYFANTMKKGFGGWKEAQRQGENFRDNSNVKEGKLNVLPFWEVGRVPKRCFYLRPTLVQGPGSNFLGTRFDWFEAYWILKLDCTLVLSLILGSPNQELSFLIFFGLNQLIFPPKQVPCRFSLNLPLFGLGPFSKDLGTNLKLRPIRLLEFIGPWTLDPRLKLL